MKWARLGAGLVTVLVAVAAIGSAAAHHKPRHPVPPGHAKKADRGDRQRDRGARAAVTVQRLRHVNFAVACRFSHRAADDPIVHPGQPGRSHDHSFVGNTTTDAFSTVSSLLGATTTCHRPADLSAYWLPTLLVNGQAVAPAGATIYYRRQTLAPVQPFPLGLKMIAGDAHPTAPQPRRVTTWSCGALAGIAPSSTPPLCPDAARRSLRLHVRFPSCWDGRSLDSADHRGHVAYAARGQCPATHPIPVPAIAIIFRYPVADGRAATLSSGGQLSAHADFFNAWRAAELARLVDGCLNALRHCGVRG